MYLLVLARIFDFRRSIWNANNDLVKVTIQCFANEIEVFKVDAFCYFVVHLIDGCWPYAGLACEVGLRPPELAKLSGQQNLNHITRRSFCDNTTIFSQIPQQKVRKSRFTL